MTDYSPAIVQLIISGLALIGIIYQSNKQFNAHQAEIDADRDVLRQEFIDYRSFMEQSTKDIKNDIEKLSNRVDEHNNYGKEIPVIKEKIANLTDRVEKLEDK